MRLRARSLHFPPTQKPPAKAAVEKEPLLLSSFSSIGFVEGFACIAFVTSRTAMKVVFCVLQKQSNRLRKAATAEAFSDCQTVVKSSNAGAVW